MHLACGQPGTALERLGPLQAAARAANRTGAVIESLALEVEAYNATGDLASAFDKL